MLYEKEQAMVDMIEDRPELKALQEQFVLNLPEVIYHLVRFPSKIRAK